MGSPAARLGDRVQGICNHGRDDCPHPWTGQIVGGASTVLSEGNATARLGDKTSHTGCPHCSEGTITAGSSTVLAEGGGVAHIGDKVITPGGEGSIVGSSQSVIVD